MSHLHLFLNKNCRNPLLYSILSVLLCFFPSFFVIFYFIIHSLEGKERSGFSRNACDDVCK